jgi:hypothetical protein
MANKGTSSNEKTLKLSKKCKECGIIWLKDHCKTCHDYKPQDYEVSECPECEVD